MKVFVVVVLIILMNIMFDVGVPIVQNNAKTSLKN